jgi:hypothetical protein
MSSVHFASDCILRNENEHRDRVAELGMVSKKTREYRSKQWGINCDTVLSSIPGFEVTSSLLHDPMHDILEGVARYELRAMLHEFVNVKKYFTLAELNCRIVNFEYNALEARDKPQVLEAKALKRGSTLGQSAASMMHLMMLLPLRIGDKVKRNDPYWVNFLRLLKILLLSISPVTSSKTVQSLEVLIAAHNSNFIDLYEDETFRPKMHFMVHYPDQILNFGPLRNHWCMRNEAKNGFFKMKRWFNFKNLPKSLAFYHQQWMCLQMTSASGQRSESFLYAGDEVCEGDLVDAHLIPATHGCIDGSCKVLLTETVVINGHKYSKGMIMLLQRHDKPEFAEILNIIVADKEKYLNCCELTIAYFSDHLNMFSLRKSDVQKLLPVVDLQYKWPQLHHKLNDELLVMLTNCDDVWML